MGLVSSGVEEQRRRTGEELKSSGEQEKQQREAAAQRSSSKREESGSECHSGADVFKSSSGQDRSGAVVGGTGFGFQRLSFYAARECFAQECGGISEATSENLKVRDSENKVS
jgi:hypothetical protein